MNSFYLDLLDFTKDKENKWIIEVRITDNLALVPENVKVNEL